MSFSGDVEPKSMLCPMKIGAQSFSYVDKIVAVGPSKVNLDKVHNSL